MKHLNNNVSSRNYEDMCINFKENHINMFFMMFADVKSCFCYVLFTSLLEMFFCNSNDTSKLTFAYK